VGWRGEFWESERMRVIERRILELEESHRGMETKIGGLEMKMGGLEMRMGVWRRG
jgi:hypothetical protein